MSNVLPMELVREILFRVGALKNLVRMKIICKEWKEMISEERFGTEQIERSLKDPSFSNHMLLLNAIEGVNNEDEAFHFIICSIGSMLSDHVTFYKSITCPLPYVDGIYSCFLNTCHTFMCVVIKRILEKKEDTCVGLWNPSTNEISLDYPSLDFGIEGFHKGCKLVLTPQGKNKPSSIFAGFGYDSVSRKYKVVFLYGCNAKSANSAFIYSFGDASWRSNKYNLNLEVESNMSSGAFIESKNTLTWLGRDSKGEEKFCTFDLGTETTGSSFLPPPPRVGFHRRRMNIGVMNDFLTFHCNDEANDDTRTGIFSVWIMNKFGVQESWTNILSIPYDYNRYYREGVRSALPPDSPIWLSQGKDCLMRASGSPIEPFAADLYDHDHETGTATRTVDLQRDPNDHGPDIFPTFGQFIFLQGVLSLP